MLCVEGQILLSSTPSSWTKRCLTTKFPSMPTVNWRLLGNRSPLKVRQSVCVCVWAVVFLYLRGPFIPADVCLRLQIRIRFTLELHVVGECTMSMKYKHVCVCFWVYLQFTSSQFWTVFFLLKQISWSFIIWTNQMRETVSL